MSASVQKSALWILQHLMYGYTPNIFSTTRKRFSKDINFGSIYENAAAQELKAHGFDLYYFNSKKQGKLDFIVEQNGNVLPIEIKSGKDYTKHAALSNVMVNEDYHIKQAYVLHNGNVSTKEKIAYLSIYMLMFVQKVNEPNEMIYKIDLDAALK